MSKNNRYKDFEQLMTAALLAGVVIFVLYMIVAGVGIVWLKILLAIIDLLLCIAGLAFLYMSRELTRQRSLWMSCGFFALFVCLLVSLILQYP